MSERMDADAFARNRNPALVVIEVPRARIEAGEIGSTLEKLLVLSDTVENARLYRDSVMLMVHGYNDDKRELCEIPEVRQFFTKLTQEWPHWLWFLAKDGLQVKLLIMILADAKRIRSAGGMIFSSVARGAISAVLMDLWARGNAMFTIFGISREEITESVNSVVAELEA